MITQICTIYYMGELNPEGKDFQMHFVNLYIIIQTQYFEKG